MPELSLSAGPVEYRRIDGDPDRPALVLLHEGLGCVALWRRLPDRLAAATGRTVAAYSRHGYGGSGGGNTSLAADYLHAEARQVLPEVLDRLALTSPVLIGHSDGASIALIHAAAAPVSGLVLLAPHVFVEEETLTGIRMAVEDYREGELAARLRTVHDAADVMFGRWSRLWLSPGFRDWSIEDLLPEIDRPVLLIQGAEDQYGTLRQLDAIERQVAGDVRRLELPDCGHFPHLERPGAVLDTVTNFLAMQRVSGGAR